MSPGIFGIHLLILHVVVRKPTFLLEVQIKYKQTTINRLPNSLVLLRNIAVHDVPDNLNFLESVYEEAEDIDTYTSGVYLAVWAAAGLSDFNSAEVSCTITITPSANAPILPHAPPSPLPAKTL